MEFNWDVDESEDEALPVVHKPDDPNPRQVSRLLIIVCIVAALIAAGGLGTAWWLDREDQRLENRIQAVLDLQTEAVQQGDGPLFFAGFDQNSDYKLNMLHPQTLTYWQNGPQVEHVDFDRDSLWVRAGAEVDGELRYKTLFLDNSTGTPILQSDSARFWVRLEERETAWGTLQINQVDLQWEDEITAAIETALNQHCATPCPIEIVSIQKELSTTADPNVALIPSPHIHGLDQDGNLLPSYWEMLENRIIDSLRLQPVTIAVPENDLSAILSVRFTYEFENPGRKIEVITYNEKEPLPEDIFLEADVVLYQPTLDDILAGNILNLTSMVINAHDDLSKDVYAQLWASPWWEDRIWFIPLTAELPLIYLDSKTFNTANLPIPDPISWDWAGFEQLLIDLTGPVGKNHGLVSLDPDILYARAYQLGNRCRRPITVWCDIFLDPDEVLDAYQFYTDNQQRIFFPTEGSLSERLLEYNQQSSISTGQTSMWVSTPVLYESYLDSRNARVLAFPSTDYSAGVSPLKVKGLVISAHSDAQISARDWINHLTYQPTLTGRRQIPLRPSVASTTGFWNRFPEPLGQVTRNAFSTSRPVRLGDELYFDLEILEQIRTGAITPEEGLKAAENLRWFGN